MYFDVFLNAGQRSDEGYMSFNINDLKAVNIAKIKEISFILLIKDQADLFGENPIDISMYTVNTSADPSTNSQTICRMEWLLWIKKALKFTL